jgi:hypothetical protein
VKDRVSFVKRVRGAGWGRGGVGLVTGGRAELHNVDLHNLRM